MIFVVLYKYLSCAVDKTIDTGYTTITDCNTNYRIIILMMLFIHIYVYNNNNNNNNNNK